MAMSHPPNQDFLSFVATEDNWFYGPQLQVGITYEAGTDLDRVWAELWRDQAIRGPFEDHTLSRPIEALLKKESYGYLELAPDVQLGFRLLVMRNERASGYVLWLLIPPRMVSRFGTPRWYLMGPEIEFVHDGCLALVQRLASAMPFRLASILEESWSIWPEHYLVPSRFPRGAIVVHDNWAEAGTVARGDGSAHPVPR